jgi:hypothetical protein
MGAAREVTQADFDLERFINMFDEALTSNDPRVKNALQSLMMMVILTQPEAPSNVRIGPLRQLYEDVHNINRRLGRVEDDVRGMMRPPATQWPAEDYYTLKAAAQMAQSIDQDVMKELSAQTAMAINGGKIKGSK